MIPTNGKDLTAWWESNALMVARCDFIHLMKPRDYLNDIVDMWLIDYDEFDNLDDVSTHY